MKSKLLPVILLLLLCVPINESYKILGIFHTHSKSHYIAGGALMKGLAEKGHDVTVISPFPQEKPLKNFRDVTILGLHELIDELFPNITDMESMSVAEKLTMILKFGTIMANFTLNHDVLQTFLKTTKEQYDVVVVEIFMNEAFLGLGHYFNAPVVGFCSFGASKWSNEMVGNPTPMSYVPHMQLTFTDKMSFYQRILNVLTYMAESIFMDLYYMPKQVAIYNAIFPDPKPTLEELQKNVSLVLLNSHFSLNFPRPYVPNMIEVGGLQINRTPKKLPHDLQQLLDKAEDGVIYFSLGSNIKPKNIPMEKQNEILNAFGKLKQKVLWKWDDPLVPGKPDNVFISSWYPQDDLLAHPNLKLFITHGGLLSITETIYHAVPIIGVPLFADQHTNMAKAESAGYAITILLNDLNEATLSTAITEIFNNDKYSKKIKLMSERYRDQPLTPLETAIYWTEYVARHKGAPHMRSAGLDLSFFSYHSLDVFATLLGALYLLWRLIKWGWCKLFLRKNRTKRDGSHKKKKEM